jgi:hypothetical protein
MSFEAVIARNKIDTPEVVQITSQSMPFMITCCINYTAYRLSDD